MSILNRLLDGLPKIKKALAAASPRIHSERHRNPTASRIPARRAAANLRSASITRRSPSPFADLYSQIYLQW